MILDEFTTALDAAVEVEGRHTLPDLRASRGILAISHTLGLHEFAVRGGDGPCAFVDRVERAISA